MGWLQVEQRAVVIKSQKKLQNYIVDIMILKIHFLYLLLEKLFVFAAGLLSVRLYHSA